MTAGRLIVLLGGDGSGKTTVQRAIGRSRPEWLCTSFNPRDLYPLPGLEHMNWALRTHPAVYVQRMRDLGRATYLTHTLALLAEERVLPALAAGRVVVCDSFWYRVLAKERALGSPGAGVVAALAEALPAPDLAVWLDIDPRTAWERQGRTCGFYETLGRPTCTDFARMQAAVRAEVLGDLLADVPTVVVEGERSRAAVAGEVIQAVEAVLQRGDHATAVR
jgi:thymidylate kinase